MRNNIAKLIVLSYPALYTFLGLGGLAGIYGRSWWQVLLSVLLWALGAFVVRLVPWAVNAAVKDLSHGPITLVGKVTREHAENYPWTGASSSYYIDVEGTVPEAGDIDELEVCNPRDLRGAGFLYRMDSEGKRKVQARFDVSPEIYRRLQTVDRSL